MNKILITYYDSPCGRLCLGAISDTLCLCDWVVAGGGCRDSIIRRLTRKLDAEIVESPSPVTAEAARQLDEYFAGECCEFSLKLTVCGTEFQRRVWDELSRLARGERITYSELARRVGNEKAFRAVAGACNANSLSIFIPCHRIVGSDGTLTGYAGGKAAKFHLLALEQQR